MKKSVRSGSPLPLQLKKELRACQLARDLAQWILEDHLPVRFQLQLHSCYGMMKLVVNFCKFTILEYLLCALVPLYCYLAD